VEGPWIRGVLSTSDVVRVPERGDAEVTRDIRQRLERDANFHRLLERGIVAMDVRPGGGARLRASCFVGRAVCGDVLLELHEKVEGALAALLQHAAHDAFRVEPVSSPVSELGPLMTLLIRQFTSAVAAYASERREFVYVRERRFGSLAGGRLDITRTIRLRARGLRHLLAFEKAGIAHNTPVNKSILAALREVDRLSCLIDIPHADVARARGLAMLFTDCRDTEVVFGRREILAHRVQMLLTTRLASPIKDILALSGVLLSHESFEHAAGQEPSVPRSWFLNLETLFETAVRAVLSTICRPACRVFKAGGDAPRIFEHELSQFKAYPDVVIAAGRVVRAVGDVKYKAWSGTAEQADLYQLLVHAAAFHGERSFLVFPHHDYGVRPLGPSATGTPTWLFAVDIKSLQRDLARALDDMGVDRPDASLAPLVESAAR